MGESSLCHSYPNRNKKFSLWDNRLTKGEVGEKGEEGHEKKK